MRPARPGAFPQLAFALVGLVFAAAVRGRHSSVLVQLELWAAAAAFLAVGGLCDELLSPEGEAAPLAFPVHRLALGQVALVLWFYLRSASCLLLHLPGVTRIELWAIALGGLAFCAHRARSRRPEAKLDLPQLALWAALWGGTWAFVALFSGMLQPPSGDPDQHAWLARLVADAGHVVLDQRPYSDAPLHYPSAFAALNAVWMLLSSATPVAVVDCQAPLQACLAVGLIIEAMAALRGRPPLFAGLAVLAFALGVLVVPLHPVRSHLEGTPRLAHTALWILPLTLALRLFASRAPRRRSRGAVLFASAFALAWALGTNPGHLPAQAALVVGALLAAALLLRDRGEPLWPRPGFIVASLAVVALVVLCDAWVQLKLHGGRFPQVDAANAPPLALWPALGAALRSINPSACLPSERCGAGVWWLSRWLLPPLLAASAVLLWRRAQGASRACALAVAALAATLLVAHALDGGLARLFADWPGMQGGLLRGYTHEGLALSSAFLFVLLFGVGLLLAGLGAARLPALARAPDAAVAVLLALVVAACALVRPGWAEAVRQGSLASLRGDRASSQGPIDQTDLAFVAQASFLVPAADRVLLPSALVQIGPWEFWAFPMALSRAVLLYSRMRFAFFVDYGGEGFSAADYQEHVCRRFDAPWLLARGVRWVVMSGATLPLVCVADWPATKAELLDEKLRLGDRVLYRLREPRR